MQLFMKVLEREVAKLHENNIRLNIIGDRSRFDRCSSTAHCRSGEQLTAAQ